MRSFIALMFIMTLAAFTAQPAGADKRPRNYRPVSPSSDTMSRWMVIWVAARKRRCASSSTRREFRRRMAG